MASFGGTFVRSVLQRSKWILVHKGGYTDDKMLNKN